MATAIIITMLRLTGILLAVGTTPVVGVTLVERDIPVPLIEVVGDIPVPLIKVLEVTSVVGVLMLVGVVPIDCVDVVTLMTVKRFQ